MTEREGVELAVRALLEVVESSSGRNVEVLVMGKPGEGEGKEVGAVFGGGGVAEGGGGAGEGEGGG